MADESKDILTLLSGINSVEDFSTNEKVILETALDEMKAGYEEAKALIDSPISVEEALMKYQQIDKKYRELRDKIDVELDRISQLPDAADPVLSWRGEYTGRVGYIVSEMSMLMMEIMSK